MQTIFVVDDAEGCRQPMARLLRSEGCDTVCACNGLEALEALRGTTPALILLDLSMPEMDGIQFLKALHGVPEWAGLPVIVVSGEASGSPLREATELGAKEVLVKANYTPGQLLASIRRHLHA
jgi:CheY-like chemotaxis protein